MSIYVGADPGADGAVVVLGTSPVSAMLLRDYEAKGHELGYRILRDAWRAFLRSIGQPICFLAIEHVVPFGQSIKGGAHTAARMASRAAMLRVVLDDNTNTTIRSLWTPTPVSWRTTLAKWSTIPAKDPKGWSVAFCRQHLPQVNLTPGKRTKPHDGIADAACLAFYARLKAKDTLHSANTPG